MIDSKLFLRFQPSETVEVAPVDREWEVSVCLLTC